MTKNRQLNKGEHLSVLLFKRKVMTIVNALGCPLDLCRLYDRAKAAADALEAIATVAEDYGG